MNTMTTMLKPGSQVVSQPGKSARLQSKRATVRPVKRAQLQTCCGTKVSVGVIGRGLIGSELLDQMTATKADLAAKGVDLHIAGVAEPGKLMSNPSEDWRADWEKVDKVEDAAGDLAKQLSSVSAAGGAGVIVDCTAAPQPAAMYADWLRAGVSVVTPNKKCGAGPLDAYKDTIKAQREGNSFWMYETTVGAGLPILDTLQGLLASGDEVTAIEGIFSGTLSYIFNTFDGSVPFSDVVKVAREQGFTEPDPRDDLNGLDVARKVTILARECGLDVELDDVPIESLVNAELAALGSADEYLEALPKFDDEFAARHAAAVAKGNVLRYVGAVDLTTGKVSVELRELPGDHPFAGLQGADNIVSFSTKRYAPPLATPLVVRGPGAGAPVTAGGVFRDVLRVAERKGAQVI
eukprot:CAMPEP_0197858196 /NCGR_PEP_ID=MMETSP1438-20131217/31820_1 /TAXON_ID=1461541 /ORGANISM="Pterosperma sp., Strain CCMP1384" /LENGTH=406 /DNA_ID=CAMNT_0043474277 /DNA_START=97 /DNA_END=1317 /DNA_ORIENTATION=+